MRDGLEIAPSGIGSGKAQVLDMSMPVKSYFNNTKNKQDREAKRRVAEAKAEAKRRKDMQYNIPEFWDIHQQEIYNDVDSLMKMKVEYNRSGIDYTDPSTEAYHNVRKAESSITNKASTSKDMQSSVQKMELENSIEHNPKWYNDKRDKFYGSKTISEGAENLSNFNRKYHNYTDLVGTADIGKLTTTYENKEGVTVTNINTGIDYDKALEEVVQDRVTSREGQVEYEEGLIDNKWDSPEGYHDWFKDEVDRAVDKTTKTTREKDTSGGFTMNFGGGGGSADVGDYHLEAGSEVVDVLTSDEVISTTSFLTGDWREVEQKFLDYAAFSYKDKPVEKVNLVGAKGVDGDVDDIGSVNFNSTVSGFTMDEDGNIFIIAKRKPERRNTSKNKGVGEILLDADGNPTEQHVQDVFPYKGKNIATIDALLTDENGNKVDLTEFMSKAKAARLEKEASDNNDSNAQEVAAAENEVETPLVEIKKEDLVGFSKNLPSSVKMEVKDGNNNSISITVGKETKKLDLTNKDDRAIFDAINSGDKKAMNDFLFND